MVMAGLKSKRVPDNSNNGYTETLEYKVLHQSNTSKNANKFYVIELQKHPKNQYRVFTHYGRLGITNVYEVREECAGCLIKDESIAKKEFDTILREKLRGKTAVDKETGEKVKESYVIVDVAIPTIGSENIRGKAEKKVSVNLKTAIDTSSYDPAVSKLVDQLIEENVHNITSLTSLKFTSNGFETPVGSVTPDHVKKSRDPLTELNKLLDKNGKVEINRDVRDLNNLYFSLIPHPFGRKITESDLILDSVKLQQEFDLLDQLETAVQMGSAMAGNAKSKMDALGTDIELLEDKSEWARIKNYIESSKAGNHRGSNVWEYKPLRAFKIKIPNERKRFEVNGKKKGNVEEVFHGSASSNCLSIMHGGLIIPPVNAPHVCGRNFGAGVYGASNSSKSLNYSIGYWGGRKSKNSNAFLFLADFAMGKTYITQESCPKGAPPGYDSLWAKAGRTLYNDELIVYDLSQCTLKYIVEMANR